jgi:NAD-dependent dihydropyrimidine dehydrogenase PreA subunit/flavodoxin
MNIEAIDFYYFSGTGNTLLVVKKMKEVFETQGVTVNLHRIEATKPEDLNPQHTIGLGFPVAEQATYPFVWNFIRAMPPAQGTPVFMVDTLLLFSGGIVGPIRKIVSQKGYTPIGAKEIFMPNNLFPKKEQNAKNEATRQKGLEEAERYAHDILQGRSTWGRIPLLSDFMGIFSQKEWAWNFLRKFYPLQIDPQKCSRCKLCVKLCPVENIEMKGYPEYKNACIICMRCFSFCPSQAIYSPSHAGAHPYRAVKALELLKSGNRQKAESSRQ